MWSGYRSFLSRLRVPRRAAPVLIAVVAVACAGRSTTLSGDDDTSSNEGARGGKPGHAGATGGSTQLAGRGGGGAASGTGGSGDTPYTDPGCPDAAAPAPVVECDVFDSVNTCGDGLVCKPDVQHPFGSGCDQQVFNQRCVSAGSGQQGDACDNGMSDCAEGFICVVGAAHGPRCLRMCPLDGSTRCPAGYICGATDADGIGVCA